MIAVLGSINLDFVASASRLPAGGETVPGLAFKISPGGKGANQALAGRRAGSQVIFAGLVGKDDHGSAAAKHLVEAGVDLSLLRKATSPTGVASIFVGDHGENMIISVPGANGDVGTREIDDLFSRVGKGDTLLLQMEIPAGVVLKALSCAREAGVRTVLNIAPFTKDCLAAGRLADVVIMNETELEELRRSAGAAIDDLPAFFDLFRSRRDQIFVVTKGKDGAVAFHDGQEFRAAAAKITPVDTIGAGDTFVAYFAAGLDSGISIGQALERAAVADFGNWSWQYHLS